MGRMRRVGLVAIIILMLPVFTGTGGGYFFVQRTLPQVNGALQVSGLQAPVEVVRDRWGVPHIYATNDADLFFAQGWVTAQDRLFQMEVFRRTGRGTLSEIFGKATVEADQFLRTVGLFRAATAEVDQLDAPSREMLEAYARGVNAYIESARDRLPVEFALLGAQPGPWEPVDSIALGKMMALDLGANWQSELLRSALVAKFGEDGARDLAPGYPADAPLIVPGAQVDLDLATALLALDQRVQAVRSIDSQSVGSNNWVVAGAKTATGKPLLANDPHLGIRMPALWYEVHLQSPGLNVSGASLPGAPGVVIGHNERIAWGMTNLGADVQDLYVERINPDNPRQYLFGGRWEDFQVLREEITVKGEREPLVQEVLISRHGPLLNGVVKGLGQPLALRWTALIPTQVLRSVLMLNKAGSWSEFHEALRYFAVPGQNFVYADVDGNIGYQFTGMVPIRAKGNGLAPVPGWTGEYEWTGFIPYDQVPTLYNPPSGIIATANNKVVGDDYPYFISSEWAPPFRVRRIDALLSEREKLSMADFQRIQSDVYAFPEHQIASYLGKLQPWDERSRRAIEIVRQWDGNLTADSAAGAIVGAFYRQFAKNVFAGPLGPELWEQYQPQIDTQLPAVLNLLSQPGSAWFTSVRTPASPSKDKVVQESLKQALEMLSLRFGGDPSGWRWGRLHTATFAHPLGQVWPLGLLFNIGPLERPGSRSTINANSYNPAKGFDQTSVSSLRLIADLGDLDRSLFVITTGESGQVFSPYYGDQNSLWLRGDYHPMPFSRATVDAAAVSKLTLQTSR